MQLRTSKLAKMTARERDRALGDLVAAARAPRNGQAAGIDARIAEYEQKYGMTSETMRARFAAGELADNEDTSSWLMLLAARGRGR